MNRLRLLQIIAAILLLATASSAAWVVVYVKWDSPGPTFDGKSWATAFHSVQEGINTAAAMNQVLVAKGVYIENITLKDRVYLYGGYNGTETSWEQRDWNANETILDGRQSGTVVTALSGLTGLTTISGFTIRNGAGTNGKGGGIYCYNGSPTIQYNKIISNTAGSFGGGICCEGSCASDISSNLIIQNSAPRGGGIYCATGEAWLSITNNTIVGNGASTSGGGIDFGLSYPTPSNNIVAFNTSGMYRDAPADLCSHANCVYGNTNYNYSGISPGYLDISADPCFVDRANGDYHIRPWSPCVNTGCDYAPGITSWDMDGEDRVFDREIDIGADEFNAPFAMVNGHKTLANDALAYMRYAIVTAAFTGFFYVEAYDRSSGIRVDKAGHTLTVGMLADVSGWMKTNATGERYIAAERAVQSPPPYGTGTVDPVGVIVGNIGGAGWNYDPLTGVGQMGVKDRIGLNNIGMLVTTTGNVTYSPAAAYVVVSDGSKFTDPSGYKGIRISIPTGLTKPAAGKNVRITGISSIFKSGTDYYPLIRVRSQADIVVFD